MYYQRIEAKLDNLARLIELDAGKEKQYVTNLKKREKRACESA
jgi:hypothetical protein